MLMTERIKNTLNRVLPISTDSPPILFAPKKKAKIPMTKKPSAARNMGGLLYWVESLAAELLVGLSIGLNLQELFI